jgi:hypothetical protein
VSDTARKMWRNALGQTLEELKAAGDAAPQEQAPGRNDGLTDAEGKVMDLLTEAAMRFARLPTEHPSDLQDVIDAVHRCQEILAVRVVRRHYPQGWPTRSPAT